MRLHRPADAASFLRVAGEFLSAHEAVRNLPLTIAGQCVADPTRYPGPNYFAAVEGARGIEGAALMTPPYRLQTFVEPGPGVGLVVADVAAGRWSVPGVTGPEAAARAFAAAWCARGDVRSAARRRLRTFELTEVTPAPATPGAMRPAVAADLPIVASWYSAFEAEAHGPGGAVGDIPAAELGARALRAGRVFVWDDGGPAAQAAIQGTTPRGVRVGAVYTPPEKRCRGYATALVAALSRRSLDEGRTFCFLFTDLANPVSNSIYRKVGYRPVADFEEIDFVPAA